MYSVILDYTIFVVFLLGSTLYPLWGNLRRNKSKDTKQGYVFANGQVGVFSMMLSIARGTLGVRAFLGYPSELFYRGAGMWETLYGLITAYPIVCFIFVPVYLNLGVTSVYQYLDLRFKSKLVRRLASGTFILRNVFVLGITLYTPCVALKSVASIPYWASFLLMTLLGIAFTIFGNLKAAITADVIQGITTVLVSFGVIAQGVYEAGGIEKTYTINRDEGRLNFFHFSGDITTRVDTLSAWLGQLFISLSVLGCQQNNVQRYMSMKSEKDVRHTLMANVPFVSFLFSLAWLVGMGIFATYYNCDPFKGGYIGKMDELLPYFIIEKLSYIPGFMGLFMATLFNGSLCIFVSSLNSIATVTWEDFLSPMPFFSKYGDNYQLYFIKSLGVIFAVICMGIAFLVSLFSGVIEISMFVNGATTGPLVGVFIVAMLIPFVNSKGAAIGMIVSHAMIIALTATSYITKNFLKAEFLPTSTDGCNATTNYTSVFFDRSNAAHYERLVQLNETILTHVAEPLVADESSFLESFVNMSYMYYSAFGSLVTVVVAMIVSLCTTSEEYDRKLIHPLISRTTELKKKPNKEVLSTVVPKSILPEKY